MSTAHHRALVLLAVALPLLAQAQDGMPRRKAGLWEMTMQMQGMPGGMGSRQCIDDKTDEALQRKAMEGGPQSHCTQSGVKRSAGGVEFQSDCTSPEGKSHVVARLSGDMQAGYRMDNQVSFDPPRHGLREAHMTVDAKYLGACPADMKPGDIRMANGMTMNPSQAGRPGLPPGMDPAKMKAMSPDELRQMAEQMKKAQAPKSP